VNALLKAKSAYAAAKAPTRTARNTEYEILARITHRMIVANGKGSDGFKDLVAAVSDNRKLWTLFTSDLAKDGNKLPDELKQRLFHLARFTREHSSKVLARKASVQPLVEINTAIMRGLRSGAS
jgi:flagellar protein FlaF